MSCIDQWFSTRRLCPLCKHDAGKPLALAPPPLAATASPQPANAAVSSSGGAADGAGGAAAAPVATPDHAARGSSATLPRWVRDALAYFGRSPSAGRCAVGACSLAAYPKPLNPKPRLLLR